MDGIARVLDIPEVRTIAIVGCSKNSGKTTALNHLLDALARAGQPVGLLSIGIDGEEADFWLGVPKPRVSVQAGWLVATADQVLKSGTAHMRTVARTGAVTPLGELVVARVEQPGLLLLAGVRHKADVRNVLERMRALGAAKILIDGSYQRLMSADPEVSDGVILATGAILGRTVGEVVRRTGVFLDRLTLPAADHPGDAELVALATREHRLAARDSRGHAALLADGGDEGLRLPAGELTVAVPGVVTDRIVRVLSRHRAPVRLIAADPTRLFASAPLLHRFREKGGEVLAGRRVRLLAVAVNPFSVLGYELPLEALIAGLRARLPGVPLFSSLGEGPG